MTIQPPTLDPVRPNAGVRIAYQDKLDRLIAAMVKAVNRDVTACYREHSARVTMDASPATALRQEMRRQTRKWLRRFDELAPTLAKWFAATSAKTVDASFKASLRKAGFTVRFKQTLAEVNAQQAIVAENVSLIRSIPSQYFTQIEGSVMRAVSVGGDLAALTAELQKHEGVTFRRARLIAYDQNSKCTAALERVRQIEAGITEAVWQHSGGGNEPRPDHVAYSGKTYDIVKGALISDKRIWPGTEIYCRCFSRPVVPNWIGEL